MSRNHEPASLVRHLYFTRAASAPIGSRGPVRVKTELVRTSVSGGAKRSFHPLSVIKLAPATCFAEFCAHVCSCLRYLLLRFKIFCSCRQSALRFCPYCVLLDRDPLALKIFRELRFRRSLSLSSAENISMDGAHIPKAQRRKSRHLSRKTVTVALIERATCD